jgi:N-acetylmuramoyl-L-alanine amidase
MRSVAISSGHGLHVRGASGYLDEVDEARKVVTHVAELLRSASVPVSEFHDNTSKTPSENLNRICAWHNSQTRDLDVSVHFNAYQTTSKPMGTEVLYVTQKELARDVCTEIARAGAFLNRGPKKRTDLAFLNGTTEPAILIEVCFVDSSADAGLYSDYFDDICLAIARETGDFGEPPEASEVVTLRGKVSWFGGPDDEGVAPDEGLAFIYKVEDAPELFLPAQPPGTTGLARRLDPKQRYIACRWDYDVTSKEDLLDIRCRVTAPKTGKSFIARPADWGPHHSTERMADISPGLMEELGIETDDEIIIEFPVEENQA